MTSPNSENISIAFHPGQFKDTYTVDIDEKKVHKFPKPGVDFVIVKVKSDCPAESYVFHGECIPLYGARRWNIGYTIGDISRYLVERILASPRTPWTKGTHTHKEGIDYVKFDGANNSWHYDNENDKEVNGNHPSPHVFAVWVFKKEPGTGRIGKLIATSFSAPFYLSKVVIVPITLDEPKPKVKEQEKPTKPVWKVAAPKPEEPIGLLMEAIESKQEHVDYPMEVPELTTKPVWKVTTPKTKPSWKAAAPKEEPKAKRVKEEPVEYLQEKF